MARIRAIHARATQDDDFASLPMAARLLWAYLPCYADRQGRLEDRPLVLKGSVFPTDDVDVGSMLTAFQERGWIIRYQAGGKRLIQIVSFLDYQRPDHHEKESVLPGPPGWELQQKQQNAKAAPRPCPGKAEGTISTVTESPGKADLVIRDPGDPVVPVEIPPNARACDPGTTEPELPVAGKRLTGQDLLRLFGQVRTRVIPGTLPWDTARDPKGDAGTFASLLGPEETADVEKSMQLALEHIRDGKGRWADPRNGDVSFAFGSWKSGFHALREELRGIGPARNQEQKPARPQAGVDPEALRKYGVVR